MRCRIVRLTGTNVPRAVRNPFLTELIAFELAPPSAVTYIDACHFRNYMDA